jgi:hypothetical protein
MPTAEPYRKVLLVLIEHVPTQRVLDAACALCDRLGAGLEIVRLGDRLPEDLLVATVKEITHSGLNCAAVARPDWGVEDLVEWANSRACVATVMVPAYEREAMAATEQPENDRWHHLACPLVVVGRES